MSMFWTLDDVKVIGKRVLVRLDLNVPIKDGKIIDQTRIERILPTLNELLLQNAKIVIISHLGRPKGSYNKDLSLEPLAASLGVLLETPVTFLRNCIGEEVEQQIQSMNPREIVLLENLRFEQGEEKNDPIFARQLSRYGDIFVNDAFSVSHRAHASTVGITEHLPSYAGRLMEEELNALTQCLDHPEPPLTAIVAGAKISTKLLVLKNLVQKVNHLVLGGGIANTFLLSRGIEIGSSLCEKDLVNECREIEQAATESGCQIVLPEDCLVAHAPNDVISRATKSVADIEPQDAIYDFGPQTTTKVLELISTSKTVLWNGPVGLFEIPPFDTASIAIANCLGNQTTQANLLSIAGGGETLAVLAQAGQLSNISFASTAGGAFLEWIEGRELPGVAALSKKRKQNATA